MALWSLLGPRGVDVAAWENFGLEWVTDATKQLKLADLRVFAAQHAARNVTLPARVAVLASADGGRVEVF